MTLPLRLSALLSRKFLSPIIAVLAFIFWKVFLSAIPIEIYAGFVGALSGGFLLLEGSRDIIIAIKAVDDKTK